MHSINKLKTISMKISLILDLLNKAMMNHSLANLPIKYCITQVEETILNVCK
jgi:hypothetical protein